MENEINFEIPHKFTPREYQKNILRALNGGIKRACWVCHRRAGKDLTIWNWIIQEAVLSRQIIYYLFPSYAQASKAIWRSMTKDGVKFKEFIPTPLVTKMNEQEMLIELWNGSIIQLIGSENYDSLVGTNPKICVFSEMSRQNPLAWQYLRPILKENGGTAIFISTPLGKNHFYDLCEIAKKEEGWFYECLTVEDTGVLTKQDVDIEIAEGMSRELAGQEYYCKFIAGIEGSYYGNYIEEAYKSGRIGKVDYDRNFLVYTAWDIGYNDFTAIVFYQVRGNEILVIDHYESRGFALNHYIDVLNERKYNYGGHYLPADAASHHPSGVTYVQVASQLGYKMTVLPKESSVLEGINRTRGVFGRCFFDAVKCDYLIRCLTNYHSQYSEENKVLQYNPYHDWSSHCFAGDTKVLTRYGTKCIMDLPKTGEVLTLCGWKQYRNPRVAKKNALLVEVVFKGGYTVRCTPDHLFLTQQGWKYAKNLTKGTLILSGLIPLHSILMEVCTEFGKVRFIIQEVVKNYIEKYGGVHLEKYLTNVIYIIRMVIQQIIDYPILSACHRLNILQVDRKRRVPKEQCILPSMREKKLMSGILRRLEGYGIKDMRKDKRIGLNGNEKNEIVYYVINLLIALLEEMATNKNFVPQFVKQPIIECVKKTDCCEDVWDITVPNVAHFSLENGAIVHNSSDSFRMMSMALSYSTDASGISLEEYRKLKAKGGWS